MRRALFVCIMDTIVAYDPYFIQIIDATGLLNLSQFRSVPVLCSSWHMGFPTTQQKSI
jgi:hypothetical protein